MHDHDQIQTLDAITHIRLRPGMYLGDLKKRGTMRMLTMLVEDCLFLCKTDDVFIEITLIGENNFSVNMTVANENSRFGNWVCFFLENSMYISSPQILIALTNNLSIKTENHELIFENAVLKSNIEKEKNTIFKKINFSFSLDTTILQNTDIDFMDLSELFFEIVLQHKNCKILLKDERYLQNNQGFLNQFYHHYPEGALHLFNKKKGDIPKENQFSITHEGILQNWTYQIGIAYHTTYFHPANDITIFLDHCQTKEILLKAIIDGLVLACKIYVKKQGFSEYKIQKKGFSKGLVLVCNPKEQREEGQSPFQHKILDKNEVKHLITDVAYHYMLENEAQALSFLQRFHEKNLFKIW
jgi:DNA gyrase/topoisomerase IV subunit B